MIYRVFRSILAVINSLVLSGIGHCLFKNSVVTICSVQETRSIKSDDHPTTEDSKIHAFISTTQAAYKECRSCQLSLISAIHITEKAHIETGQRYKEERVTEVDRLLPEVKRNYDDSINEEEVVSVDEALETILTNHLVSIGKQRSQNFESDHGISYQIIKGGSQVGGDKMYDSLGYSYCVKKRQGNSKTKYWICSVRNSTMRCPATVRQRDGTFIRGNQPHSHLIGFSTPINSPNARRSNTKRKSQTKVDHDDDSPPAKKSKHFTVVKHGTRTLMDQLKDSQGYTYSFRKASADGNSKVWGCTVRNKYVTCKANIKQIGNRFLPSSIQHNHLPGLTRPLSGQDELPRIPPGDFDGEEENNDDMGDMADGGDFSDAEDHGDSADQELVCSDDDEGEEEDEEGTGHAVYSGALQRMIPPKKKKQFIKISQITSAIVELNVGGTHFTTLKSTLNKFPSSRLAAMTKNGPEIMRDTEDRIFLDCDGATFGQILTYLRNGTMPRNENAMDVYRMAVHFQIEPLTESLEQLPLIQEKLYFNRLKETLNMETYTATKKAACQVTERIFLERKLVLELFSTCRHFTEKVKEYTNTVLQQYRAKLQTDCAGVKICHIRTVITEEKVGMAACLAYDFRLMGYEAVSRTITLKKEGGEGEVVKGLFHCLECQKSCGLVEYVIVAMKEAK